MSNALANRNERSIEKWDTITAMAAAAYESRRFGLTSVQEAQIKMIAAVEYGLPITSAFKGIYIIQGSPCLAPKVVWSLVINHPDFESYKEEKILSADGSFFGWELTLKRKNLPPITRRFTMDDARRAGLLSKDNWKAYPSNMAYWRALGYAQDVAFPDATFGLSRTTDFDINMDGDGIPQNITVIKPEQPVKSFQDRLYDAVQKYGAAEIMNANGGEIPENDEQLNDAIKTIEKTPVEGEVIKETHETD